MAGNDRQPLKVFKSLNDWQPDIFLKFRESNYTSISNYLLSIFFWGRGGCAQANFQMLAFYANPSLGSSRNHPPHEHLLKPRAHSFPSVCVSPDHGCGLWTQQNFAREFYVFVNLQTQMILEKCCRWHDTKQFSSLFSPQGNMLSLYNVFIVTQ